MAVLKIKVIDDAGADLTGLEVKVSGIDALQTNAQGLALFLVDDAIVLDISIGGTACWSGSASSLARQEVFQRSGGGYVRVAQ